MQPDRAGLAGSQGSQDETKDAGRPDSHNRIQSNMPNIMFARRPDLAIKQEVCLHTARAYVHSRLFDNEQFRAQFNPALVVEVEDASEEETPPVTRYRRIPRAFELRLFGIDPSTVDLATVVHPRDKFPDLNCRELEAVYDGIMLAVKEGRTRDHPALMQALSAICDRLKISRPSPHW